MGEEKNSSNSEYWLDRGVQNCKKADRYAQNQADLITRWFKRATKEMTDKVNQFYQKYADNNGISIKEAKAILKDPKLLKTTLDEYYALVDKYMDDPNTKALLDKMGYARNISREEFLKLQLNTILSNLYFKYDELTTDTLTKSFEETYYKEMFDYQQFTGIGSSVQRISTNQILAAVTTEWSGKNYSERIWGNQRASLARRVNRIVTTGMATGRSGKEMRVELEKEMNTSTYNARRLIRTECNYVTGQARLRAYKENGTSKYQFLAVLDLRTSEVCKKLDLKTFDVDEAKVGVNMNPMHPHCRSTTVPYVPDEEFDEEETRVARGSDGEVYKVPADMKYEDWYKKYVRGNPESELQETMLKHIYGDNAQFEKYKDLLGKEMPKSLEDFQRLKYTNSEEWEDLKEFAKYKRKYPQSSRNYFDINKEIQELKEKGLIDKRIGIAIKPVPRKIEGYGEHALERMVERNFGTEDSDEHIKRSVIAFSQFRGMRTTFYSKKGVTTLLNSNSEMITGWTKDDFDEGTDLIMEVVNKYARK